MARTWFVSVLVISNVIFVPQTLARPQQYQLKEIRARYSNDSQSYPNFTHDRSQGRSTRSTSTSFLNQIHRSRRSDPVTAWDFHYTFRPGADVVYRLHTVAETWPKAREICQGEDGHLAVINSPDESQAIGDIVAAKTYPHYDSEDPGYVLIGFHNFLNPGSESGHRTIDGRTLEQAGFAGWQRDEPNNGGILPGNEDCGSISTDGKFNDVFCDKKYAFICELPLRNEIASIGPAGPQGVPGINGEAGIPGPAGRVGERGEPGEKATDGLQGVAGERGSKGDTGPTGPDGSTGDKGDTGKMGPQGSRGPVGPGGSVGSSGRKGAAGRHPGMPGSKGEKGNLGDEGDAPRGVAGEKGFKGNAGSPGSDGPKGAKGNKGRAGPMSPPGPVGPKGSRGQAGIDGISGPPGPAGLNGRKGEPGEKGTDGQGVKGDKGSQGAAGPPGPQGSTGSIGPTGDRGPLGPSGPRGEPGLPEDIECLTVLLTLGRSRSSGLIEGGKRPIFPRNFTLRKKCEEFIMRAYERMSAPAPSRISVQPDGSKESPAKTCKDLFNAYPDKPSGFYWVDPNEGDVADAISVICYAKNLRTCIRPSKTSREEPTRYISDKREVWLSELENNTLQITYTADANQINALQLLSSHAEQGLIYRCLKSVGYYDAEGRTYDRALKLLTWNDFSLGPTGSPHFRYEIVSDGCQDRLDEWKKTEIAFRTDRPARLPVKDVRLRDVGEPNQQFAIEIGEVCFT